MTDTPKDAQSPTMTNGLIYINDIPHWDLTTDEIAFPFVMEQSVDGQLKEFLLVTHLKQHVDMQDKKGFEEYNQFW